MGYGREEEIQTVGSQVRKKEGSKGPICLSGRGWDQEVHLLCCKISYRPVVTPLTLSTMKSMEFATLTSRSSLGKFIKICLFSQKPGMAQYLRAKEWRVNMLACNLYTLGTRETAILKCQSSIQQCRADALSTVDNSTKPRPCATPPCATPLAPCQKLLTHALAALVCLNAVVSVKPLQRKREWTLGHLNVLSASF